MPITTEAKFPFEKSRLTFTVDIDEEMRNTNLYNEILTLRGSSGFTFAHTPECDLYITDNPSKLSERYSNDCQFMLVGDSMCSSNMQNIHHINPEKMGCSILKIIETIRDQKMFATSTNPQAFMLTLAARMDGHELLRLV